jgi:hypothetical protein
MTTVADIDRQVNADDAVAARLWPKLGPKVRTAYLHDRDAWIVIRRDVDAGKRPSGRTLAAQHRAFAGWARAFHTASKRPSAVTAPAVAPAAAALALPAAPVLTPAAATAAKKASVGGAGTAVAGGLVLAGVLALAARRKRA